MVRQAEKTNGFFESVAESRANSSMRRRESERAISNEDERFRHALETVRSRITPDAADAAREETAHFSERRNTAGVVNSVANAEVESETAANEEIGFTVADRERISLRQSPREEAQTTGFDASAKNTNTEIVPVQNTYRFLSEVSAPAENDDEIVKEIDSTVFGQNTFDIELENTNSSFAALNFAAKDDLGFDIKMDAVENIEAVLRTVGKTLNLNIDTELDMLYFDGENVNEEMIVHLAQLMYAFKEIADAFLQAGLNGEEVVNNGDIYSPKQAMEMGKYLQQEALKLELSFAQLGINHEVALETAKIKPGVMADTDLHIAADLGSRTPAQKILPENIENILTKPQDLQAKAGEIKVILQQLKETADGVQAKVETAKTESETAGVKTVSENIAKAPIIEALSGLKKEIVKDYTVKTQAEGEVKGEKAELKTDAKTEIKAELKTDAKLEVKAEVKTQIETDKPQTATADKPQIAANNANNPSNADNASNANNAENKIQPNTNKTQAAATNSAQADNTSAVTDKTSAAVDKAPLADKVKASAENVKTTENGETKLAASVQNQTLAVKKEAAASANRPMTANEVINNEFITPIKDAMLRSTEGNIASPIMLDGISIESAKFNDSSEINAVSPRFAKLFEKEIAEQVQRTILNTVNKNGNGLHEIRLTLNPEKLGEIRLTIQVEGNMVSARMSVENSQVKTIIEQNLQQLRDALQKQDLTAGSLDVNVGDKDAQDLQERLHNARKRARDAKGFNGEEGVMTDEGALELGVDTGRRYGTNSFEFFA